MRGTPKAILLCAVACLQLLAQVGSGHGVGPISPGTPQVPLVPVVISSSGPVAVAGTGFYFNNATGALTYNLPSITKANIGSQFCFRNAVTRTGAITLRAPALTSIDVAGTNGSAAGSLVSGGAAGDAACLVPITATQYEAYISKGTWTNN